MIYCAISRRACLGIALSLTLVVGSLAAGARADETREVKVKSLKLNVPKSWKQEKPSSNLRAGQFSVPGEGDAAAAELSIFQFGRSGVNANLLRWINQFAPSGRKAMAYQGQSAQGKYYLVDVRGTYNKSVGPPVLRKTEPVKGQRMLGVILDDPDGGLYFLKMTGPAGTVAKASESLRKAFGADLAKEKVYEIEQ